MKCAAEIIQNGTTFKGYLWEAVPPLPVPLRWEDERGAVVSWEQVVPEPVPPGQFEISGGYRAVAAPEMVRTETPPPPPRGKGPD